MSGDQSKPRQVLFVDDEAAFLANLRGIFSALARGKWEIHTAQNHAQALAQIQKQQMDLVVLDIGMPVVDGVQFLRLINRTHPGQQVVMLTGYASEEKRKECLDNGALLCLDKPIAPGGYESVFATLDALIRAPGAEGFRGMMRRVGLQEVLQMECLGAKSSVLEIFTGRVRGRVFIHDGVIIHAEQGNLVGEVALYSLLALRGGEFNLLTFTEPAQRTIQGQWEFLLMEAARLQDEAVQNDDPAAGSEHAPAPEPVTPEPDSDTEFYAAQFATPVSPGEIRIDEVVLCSGAGEVLFDWQCRSLERRLGLLEQIEQQAAQMGLIAPLGRFERVEIQTEKGHAIAQILTDRRIFVRHSGGEE